MSVREGYYTLVGVFEDRDSDHGECTGRIYSDGTTPHICVYSYHDHPGMFSIHADPERYIVPPPPDTFAYMATMGLMPTRVIPGSGSGADVRLSTLGEELAAAAGDYTNTWDSLASAAAMSGGGVVADEAPVVEQEPPRATNPISGVLP